jgi:hypothetical protein
MNALYRLLASLIPLACSCLQLKVIPGDPAFASGARLLLRQSRLQMQRRLTTAALLSPPERILNPTSKSGVTPGNGFSIGEGEGGIIITPNNGFGLDQPRSGTMTKTTFTTDPNPTSTTTPIISTSAAAETSQAVHPSSTHSGTQRPIGTIVCLVIGPLLAISLFIIGPLLCLRRRRRRLTSISQQKESVSPFTIPPLDPDINNDRQRPHDEEAVPPALMVGSLAATPATTEKSQLHTANQGVGLGSDFDNRQRQPLGGNLSRDEEAGGILSGLAPAQNDVTDVRRELEALRTQFRQLEARQVLTWDGDVDDEPPPNYSPARDEERL